jgi:outer membrane protein OmpA-like peptidoglycan-associated protein
MSRSGSLCVALCTCLLPARAAAQEPRVPFEAGVQLTWAIVMPGEPDYEAVLTVLTADTLEAGIRWSWNRGEERVWKEAERSLSTRERRRARSAYFYAEEGDRNEYRGSTPAMISAVILEELKTTGRAEVVWLYPQLSARPFRGTLERMGSEIESFPVLLDGRVVTLPAIRARAVLTGEFDAKTEILFFDNPEAAWELEASAKTEVAGIRTGHTRLVRIGTGAREPQVAGALAEECRASVHDIYFATGSDALDATSSPALQAIADALRSHPEWTVTIIGHTDSEGSEESNLDLSRRRAGRVLETLVADYGIDTERLRSEGRGETEPVSDNRTPEGRAMNRRVDLERPCGAKETGG